MKKIKIQDRELVIQPSNYLIVRIILWIVLILLTILYIILIINPIEEINLFNINNFINSIYYYMTLFYLLVIIGLASILTIKKHIPLKIVLNAKKLLFIYKNYEFSFPIRIWQYYFIYKLSGQRNYFIGLVNTNDNIKLELFEGNNNQIQTVAEFIKKNLKINLFDNFEIPIQKCSLNLTNDEFCIKNRNRKYLVILLLVFLFITLFFLKFLFIYKDLDIKSFVFSDYLNITIGIFVFLVFYILIFYNIFNIFFDTSILKNDNKLFIYKQFFLNPNVKILVRKYFTNRNLACNLQLFYDRKYSYIELFYLNEYPKEKIKIFNKNYYKITLFDYNLKEAFELYQKLIHF